MAIESSSLRKKITKESLESALETRTFGQFANVLAYHGVHDFCHCARHEGAALVEFSKHTVDIELRQGARKNVYYEVPILMQGYGLIDVALQINDRVLIQFLHGDSSMPVVVGVYRSNQGKTNGFPFSMPTLL